MDVEQLKFLSSAGPVVGSDDIAAPRAIAQLALCCPLTAGRERHCLRVSEEGKTEGGKREASTERYTSNGSYQLHDWRRHATE